MLQLRPPSVSSRSNTVTSTCCCCKKKLAAPPPIPPPMIATRLVLAVCACAASTHREKHAAVRTPRRAMPVMCGQEHVLANCTPIRLRLQICTRSCSNKHRDGVSVTCFVRDERTHPHRPRLVVYHSTCRPLSSSPPREQLCNRSCSNKHTHRDTWRVFTGNLKFASEVLFLQAHRRETETHFTALELECHRKLEPTTPSRKHSGDSSARHSTTA